MRGPSSFDDKAAIGVGALIIFIAMVLIAGVTASVMLQVMNSMQQQAMKTAQETIRDVSDGLKVTHVSGYSNGSKITQMALYISTTAGSSSIDLANTQISLSDASKQVILSYTDTCFASSVSTGLFSTINASNLSATTFGVIVIRDVDSSCSSTTPSINRDDLVVLLVNTTKCFSGISTRTEIFGRVIPEFGMRGAIGFTTPSAFIDTIIELQT